MFLFLTVRELAHFSQVNRIYDDKRRETESGYKSMTTRSRVCLIVANHARTSLLGLHDGDVPLLSTLQHMHVTFTHDRPATGSAINISIDTRSEEKRKK